MSISEVTANFGFRLIDFATDPYVDDDWFNWRLLDGLLSGSQQDVPFVVGGGAVNAYTADYTPAYTALDVGKTIAFKTNNANTGACTLNVNSLGAAPIKVNGRDPASGAFASGMYIKVVWDGTNFNVVYPTFSLSQGAKITTAASGATAVNGANDFQVESNTNVGMSLLTSDASKVARYYMGTAVKPSAGGLYYDFAVDRLYLRASEQNGAYMDADGVVRNSKLPVFYYYKSGSQTPPTATNSFKPDTSLVDQGPSAPHYNSATGEFTAPIAGIYEFEFDLIAGAQTGAAPSWTIGFMVNGVQQGPAFPYITTNSSYNGHRGPFKIVLSLAKNDKVKVNMLTVTNDTAAFSFVQYFTGKLLP